MMYQLREEMTDLPWDGTVYESKWDAFHDIMCSLGLYLAEIEEDEDEEED